MSSLTNGTKLPSPPDDWFEYSYSALTDGRLALIRTQTDVHGDFQRWREEVSSGDVRLPAPASWNDDIRLSIFDGDRETDVVTVPSCTYPIVRYAVGGRWLIASARSEPGSANARIFSAAGRQEQAFALGDGIADIESAPDGTIWVGYFDEGIFGGPDGDGKWPVSSGGIVQFDASGMPCWSFNEHFRDERMVSDCYAMTLSGDSLWACYYTDFPIVRVREGEAKFWSNCIQGASAIAVDGAKLLLAGGYGDDRGRIAVVALEHDATRHLGNLTFEPPSANSPGLVSGRAGVLHIVADGVWTRLTVQKAARSLT